MKDTKGKGNTLGRRIAQLRNACGLTQEELASDLYVERTGISNYENDKRVPDIALLQKLCDKFGVSMNYLLRGNPYNEELDALTKTETDISLYLTKDGHLDLSDAPPMVKIFIVDLYQFLMQKYCK